MSTAWTKEELERVRREYPEGDVNALAASLNRTRTAIVQKAFALGVIRKYPCGRKGVKQVKKDRPIPETRICTACKKEKRLSCFYVLKHGKYGRHSMCANCLTAQTLRRLKTERDEIRKGYVASLLGVDADQLPEALFNLKRQHLLIHRELKRISK